MSTPLLRKSASWEKNLADICGYGGTVTCSGWRAPRTSTTISWCDGELGPLFVTFGEGQLRDCEVDEINSLYEGTLHVEHSCKKTHMWNGEVCVKFLDFVAKEIRRKRLSLGYTDASQCPCLAICDRAPSHQSQVFQDMRARWAKEHNVVLLGADNEGPCAVPGGYGATMQPNDRLDVLENAFLPRGYKRWKRCMYRMYIILSQIVYINFKPNRCSFSFCVVTKKKKYKQQRSHIHIYICIYNIPAVYYVYNCVYVYIYMHAYVYVCVCEKEHAI